MRNHSVYWIYQCPNDDIDKKKFQMRKIGWISLIFSKFICFLKENYDFNKFFVRIWLWFVMFSKRECRVCERYYEYLLFYFLLFNYEISFVYLIEIMF